MAFLRSVLDDVACSALPRSLKKALAYKALQFALGVADVPRHADGQVTQVEVALQLIPPTPALMFPQAPRRDNGSHQLAQRFRTSARYRHAHAHPDPALVADIRSLMSSVTSGCDSSSGLAWTRSL